MKRILSVFLAALMLAGLCAISAAADFVGGGADGVEAGSYNGGTAEGDVTITVTGDPVHKYAVDVEFETLSFTYSTGSTWNPTTHQYEVNGTGTWSDPKTVSIYNHSDLSVWYSAEASEEVTSYGEISVKFNGGADAVEPTEVTRCEVGQDPTAATFTVGLEGSPTVGQITDVVISTVTVTISKTAA